MHTKKVTFFQSTFSAIHILLGFNVCKNQSGFKSAWYGIIYIWAFLSIQPLHPASYQFSQRNLGRKTFLRPFGFFWWPLITSDCDVYMLDNVWLTTDSLSLWLNLIKPQTSCQVGICTDSLHPSYQIQSAKSLLL